MATFFSHHLLFSLRCIMLTHPVICIPMVIKCRCKFMSLGSFSNGMPRKTSFERKSIFPVVTIFHFIIILFCLNSTMLAKCFTTGPRGAP